MRRLVLACAVLASAVACSRADAPAAAAATTLRKVRVGFLPHMSWGPLMIAQSEGFFRAEGLDVEFVSALKSEESLAALESADVTDEGRTALRALADAAVRRTS